MSAPAQVDILIDIQARLAALQQTQQELRKTKGEAESFGTVLKQGLGIGTGMELARRGIEMFRESVIGAFDSAFALAKEIKQNADDIGFSAEAYQVFKNELHEAGVDMGRLTMAVSTQTNSLAAARTGAGAAAQAYRDLGLSAAKIEALPADQRLLAVARATLNATDQTKAFAAAGNILGSRGLPSLLGALKTLSSEGYGALADEMIKSGKIMSDQNAELLRQSEKQLEILRQKRTVAIGESLGFFTLLAQAMKNEPMNVLKATFAFDTDGPKGLSALLAKYMPTVAAVKPPAGDNGDAAALQERLRLTMLIAIAQEEFNTADGKIFIDETERNRQRVSAMNEEYRARAKLIDRLRAHPDSALSDDAQALQLKKLEEENKRLNDRIAGINQSAAGKIGQSYTDTFDKNNPNSLSPGQGLMTGFKSFAMQAGTIGQQIQSSIGGALSGLNGDIVGLIEKTRTWGDAGRAAGHLFLQSLVQVGMQLFAQHAIIPMLTAMHIGSEATKTAAVVAGSATRTAAITTEAGAVATATGIAGVFHSIMELGPIAGPLVFVGAVASLIALVRGMSKGFFSGGYTGDGGTHEPAGIVHRGEYVMDAATTSRIGRGRLDAMRFSSASGYAAGGFVGGGGAMEPMAMKQKLLVVYTNDVAMVETLKRSPDHEAHVLDIVHRGRGQLSEV